MAAGNTYVALASTTLSSPAASVTFSSISSAYTDLVLIKQGMDAVNGGFWLRYNSDTATNYSIINMGASGSSTFSYFAGSQNYIWADTYYTGTGTVATDKPMVKANIMNYANTTTYKTTICRSDDVRTAGSDGTVYTGVGIWRNTAAINTITCIVASNPAGANFNTGSTFSLYGIKAG